MDARTDTRAEGVTSTGTPAGASAMASAEIELALAEVCGELNAAHARLVALVAQTLELSCWEGAGIHCCEQWVAWRTGLSTGRARQVVQMARRRLELPATFAAFGAGELSVDQVSVVARHTPPAFDADVAAFARSATVSQLGRTLSRYTFDEPDTATTQEHPDPCFVSGMFDERGYYRLRAVLDADHGAVVDAALREAHDRLFHAGEVDVTWADALVDVAQRSLGAVESPARREAFRAVFHVRTDGSRACWHAGPVLPASLRRELLCDADGVVVGLRDGRPVDVGRSTRIVSTALRRLVEERDPRMPGARLHAPPGPVAPRRPLGGRRPHRELESRSPVPPASPNAPPRTTRHQR